MSDIIRINKFLSCCGVCSRRQADLLISQSRVRIRGKVAVIGDKVDSEARDVTVDNKTIIRLSKQIYLFNKPVKVITTMKDPAGRLCVGDYIRKNKLHVFPVGRLDYDTSGLLLLTSDGDYSNVLMHPRYMHIKKYVALVNSDESAFEVSLAQINKLMTGVDIEGQVKKASYAEVISSKDSYISHLFGKIDKSLSVVRIDVSEGQKHIVRNLLSNVGLPVVKLCRIGVGGYDLGMLEAGKIIKTEFKTI